MLTYIFNTIYEHAQRHHKSKLYIRLKEKTWLTPVTSCQTHNPSNYNL